MMAQTFQTKAIKITAWQAINSGVIQTGKPNNDASFDHVPDVENYVAGDWVVTFPNTGHRRVFTDVQFRAAYESVSENN